MRIGYFLSCEEFGPFELLEQARMAEEAGFGALWISDHYHPWVEAQGQSPFVWSVIGGLSRVTSRLPVYTAVTCPTVRIHPAIIAQAAATSAVMLGGRFGLGVGLGRGVERAHLRRRVALGGRAPGDAGGGRRGNAAPVGGRHEGLRRQALRRRERQDLHPAGRAAAYPGLRLRAESHAPRGEDRGRLHERRPGRRVARPLPLLGRRGQAGPRRLQGLLR